MTGVFVLCSDGLNRLFPATTVLFFADKLVGLVLPLVVIQATH